MDERIIIYGTSKKEFHNEQKLIDYLHMGLAKDEQNRFRYTQCKDADIIILSMAGLAYGHLIVDEKVPPTVEDINEFDPVKCTYLINESKVYNNPVKLYKDFGIRVTSFGRYITRKQFNEILKKAN
jgi:hypothetical protein